MIEEWVVFELGGALLGVPISNVTSISEPKKIVAVPRSLSFVEGVTDLHGLMVPVIDLSKRLGLSLPRAKRTRETRIIVLDLDDMTVSVVVDALSQVLRIDDAEIESPSSFAIPIDSACVLGTVRVRERSVVLLDLSSVLTREERALREHTYWSQGQSHWGAGLASAPE